LVGTCERVDLGVSERIVTAPVMRLTLAKQPRAVNAGAFVKDLQDAVGSPWENAENREEIPDAERVDASRLGQRSTQRRRKPPELISLR